MFFTREQLAASLPCAGSGEAILILYQSDTSPGSSKRHLDLDWLLCTEPSLLLRLFRVLKLFPSIGTDVVKHYNTVGVHKSFPQGVVS